MSNVEVFEIDDDFDPLEDLRLDEDEEERATDYLVPIPDAELSRMPEVVPLTAPERIEKLLKGTPGQQFRLLHVVNFCTTLQPFVDIQTSLESAFPKQVSVYSVAQLVQLLEQAGALECRVESEKETTPIVDASRDCLTVAPPALRRYIATPAGNAAVAARCGDSVVRAMLLEEPQYLPLYRTILEMTSPKEGCGTKRLDEVIDNNPLREEPPRFCGYFLDRLEETDAVRWSGAWVATDLGREILASDIFNN